MPALAAFGSRLTYGQVDVDGLSIAYRMGGSPTAPALLLLHGVPSWSRMYDRLMRRLCDRFRVVALDYPGFGNSAAPPPAAFNYTFDSLSAVVARVSAALGLTRYVLFMQDYGAPVGMRLAISKPGEIRGLIFQNGNLYAEGLGPVWEARAAYWADRAAHEAAIRAGHLSLETIRARHVGSDPDFDRYDPDLWCDEYAFLHRPGQAEIQMELIFDYRTNVELYPSWQAWLRTHRPPTLVLWGRYDLTFVPAGAMAFARDLPDAEIHLLAAGHFAMDAELPAVARLTRRFLERLR